MYLSPVYCDLTLQIRLFAWGGRGIVHTQQGCSSTDLALISTNPPSDKEKPRAAAERVGVWWQAGCACANPSSNIKFKPSASVDSSQHHFMKLRVLEVIR
ncbi:unnamed protein product [Rangifer tarandus platyrhynchus]|uniref:Uncharacterized protein n=2 Tax=Rangifer tarandus platyrhynchus TaxID=3082113 RepID=A0ABN8XWU8_RANTA|nr:unnamed protein product [Rangifer tarandus platyrhynchus]